MRYRKKKSSQTWLKKKILKLTLPQEKKIQPNMAEKKFLNYFEILPQEKKIDLMNTFSYSD